MFENKYFIFSYVIYLFKKYILCFIIIKFLCDGIYIKNKFFKCGSLGFL